MNDFWKIYDVLIDGIDPAIFVTEVICGQTWTAVRNDAGGLGLALTTYGNTRPRTPIDYKGMKLKEIAALSRSWNFWRLVSEWRQSIPITIQLNE